MVGKKKVGMRTHVHSPDGGRDIPDIFWAAVDLRLKSNDTEFFAIQVA
jgi:hypothetical protein